MPFVIRKVEPQYVCRGHVPESAATARNWPVGAELDAVANGALTVTIKQLASLVAKAEDIFAGLTAELTIVADRSGLLREKIDTVEKLLGEIDPKKVPVPESDICAFAARKDHFHSTSTLTTSLFTPNTRPKALEELYSAAVVVNVKSLDSLRRDGNSMELFLCTPVLCKRRRDQSLDIESRRPAAIEDLRRWTSAEALGDITVAPDCTSRIFPDASDDSPVDHKLPSPEEQVQAVALKFPAEIVTMDVSGRRFDRMSMRRKSFLSGPETQEAVKRRSRPRRPRGKRRNTIAGTDQKELRKAIGGENTIDEQDDPTKAHRSASIDILGSSKRDSPNEKKSHFNTLKAWGRSRLKLISPKSNQDVGKVVNEELMPKVLGLDDDEPTNIYETVSARRRNKDKSHERKPSSSSSSGKSTSSIPVSVPCADKNASVRLREYAAQRRERRKGNREDAPHSSSGNWSASSESGRASIGSENTVTTHPPRSTTASVGTSSTSLCHVRRLKGIDTSASSSVTSEGTLTPDIIQDISIIPFSDDGETSSVYSCDTEGYYTSFHLDSGLKTLREEELIPQSPLIKSNDVHSDPSSPIVENEYELYGRGSTSTTTSSAGTVCTTLLAPPPPERKSSLTVVAMVHGQNKNGGESPDSGHNTSSSPVESASSPACTGRSCSEFEYSESSDLEGCERIERIRSITAINIGRIPSMCVITPSNSDDEQQLQNQKDEEIEKPKKATESAGSVLMSATVGTSKMEVINGDKNLYATVQVVSVVDKVNPLKKETGSSPKTSPLSGVLEKLLGVLPGRRQQKCQDMRQDSGDYVTIADVRNNNDKRHEFTMITPLRSSVTYANTDLFRKDEEYVSLSELPKKQDTTLDRRKQTTNKVTLDSNGKVVYNSDSLRRRKGAHTTFNPGPFIKEDSSVPASPLLHRAAVTPRPISRVDDVVDSGAASSPENIASNIPDSTPRMPMIPQRPNRAQIPGAEGKPGNVRATVGKAAKCRGGEIARIGSPLLSVQPHENPKSRDDVRSVDSGVLSDENCPETKSDEIKRNVLGTNSRFNFENSSFCPSYLRPSGTTPKLSRRVLLVSDVDTPNLSKRISKREASHDKENLDEVDAPSIIVETPKAGRKVKRSESYRMANSPIMFIKKFSVGSSEKKIVRSASEELQEELLRERINYPETVISSESTGLVDDEVEDEEELTPGSKGSIKKIPTSPRPRATDLIPARVLKYSGNDTEIW